MSRNQVEDPIENGPTGRRGRASNTLVRKTLATNIQISRRGRGLTQEEVARKLGVSRETYVQWEIGNNEIAASLIPDIASALGVELSHLYGRYGLSPSKAAGTAMEGTVFGSVLRLEMAGSVRQLHIALRDAMSALRDVEAQMHLRGQDINPEQSQE